MQIVSCNFISAASGTIMSQIKVSLVLIFLLPLSLIGCLSEENEDQGLNLEVSYDSLKGNVIESYSDGELASSDVVTMDFDFSETTSENELTIFGVDTNDSRMPIEVNAKDTSIISVEFTEHGIYELTLYAIDDGSNQENLSLKVIIELQINWIESNTNNPKKLTFDPTPNNGGEHPTMIEIESTVENPEQIQDLAGDQTLEITWNVVDEYDDTCQRNSELIENGEQATWNTIHFNTYLVHELIIDNGDSDDNINVNQKISIIYDD
jgi:hypothetical protein